MHEPFTLLLSVYDGDRPDFLERAFRSAVDDQTLRPDQVVIVRDGPVREELAACLDRLQGGSPVPVTMVPLERNRGLGPALDSVCPASMSATVNPLLHPSPFPVWLSASRQTPCPGVVWARSWST